MKGADILVSCLEEQGIKHIFGYSGSSILPFLDSLSKSKKITYITGANEQLCAFSAEGYARASGKCAVVTATSGPGATNLVTAIADAYMDSVPMVAITGNVSLNLLGRDAFQETDIVGVTMPISKHGFIVKSAQDLADTIRSAFQIAQSGRKGPVLVDIPNNIFVEEAPYHRVKARLPEPAAILQTELDEAAEIINNSKHPFICAGGGVVGANASDKLLAFAQKLSCPVAVTYMGIGAFPQSDSKFAGFVGMNSSAETENAIRESDLFIGVGMRFSERAVGSILKVNPNIKLLHIDIDEAEIGKNLAVVEGVVGDAGKALNALCGLVNAKGDIELPKWKRTENKTLKIIFDSFPDAIFTTEVGDHQVAACAGLPIDTPRSFLTSGGLGAMGFGLPAAIGASVAHPHTRVINLAGDGSFNMNLPALATAVQYALPIIQIVFDNGELGMIARWQSERGMAPFGRELPSIDYVAYAKSVGAEGFRAENETELAQALAAAKKLKAPVLIDYRYKGEIR